MLWIKDGKLFDGKLTINGRTAFVAGEPDPALMRSLGWEEYTPPAPEPVPKRYSKLKVIRALGDGWEAKKLELEQAGLYDQFVAAAWLEEGDPAFAPIYASLSDEEKRILDEECQYDN